ncbi:MAG TPA: hypothetical protein VK796_01465, partial [Cytophaga sp.]|nr:hypothetical protein [Cytophaga sp.]
ILFLIVMFCGCSSKEKKAAVVEYIILGTYCGECMEHCVTMYRIDSTCIQIDTSNNFFSSLFGFTENDSYAFTGYSYNAGIVPKDFFDKMKAELPDDFIENTSKTYGSPDTHDQCGTYIELKSGGIIRKFYIDTDEKEVPDEINEYVTFLYENLEKTK